MERVKGAIRRIATSPAFALAIFSIFSSSSTADETLAAHFTIHFVETHDRLDPDPIAGISRAVTIEAVLTHDGHVHEANTAEVRRGRYFATDRGQNDAQLGDTSARAVWRVEGANKLQRLVVGKQFIAIADVEIGKAGTCSVQVKFVLEKGFGDVVMRRRDNGQMARFSQPRVTSASCSIQ
jgi:hypothetical protein